MNLKKISESSAFIFLCLLLLLVVILAVTLKLSIVYGAEKNKQVESDLILKNMNNGDLLTAPRNLKQRKKGASIIENGKVISSIGKGKNVLTTGEAATTGTAQSTPDDTIKPDKDYLDVYIGKCQFTSEGMKSAKRFLSEHPNYHLQYYGMKTHSDAVPSASDMQGIEVHLPLDAKQYDITTVPTFVLNKSRVAYKFYGDADVNEVYREIEKNLTKGEKKNGYIDLGEKGKGCKTVMVDLSPSRLTAEQRTVVNTESRPPDMRGLIAKQAVSLPETGKPVSITKQINSPVAGNSRFIVFSETQKAWAHKELQGGTLGCCTDCNGIGELWPYAQYCSSDMLKEFRVSSVPAVVTFVPIQQ